MLGMMAKLEQIQARIELLSKRSAAAKSDLFFPQGL
jgi:hypothetical protein